MEKLKNMCGEKCQTGTKANRFFFIFFLCMFDWLAAVNSAFTAYI